MPSDERPHPTAARDASLVVGLQAAVSAYLLWGFFTVYWKQLDAFRAVELIGWRVATASILMVGAAVATGRWGSLRARLVERAVRRSILAAALILTVNWTTYVWAVTNERVLETALGYFLAPLATMALGVIVFGERLTAWKWASIALAAVAIVVMTWSYGETPWVALVLGATWSSYGLVKRRSGLDPIQSLTAEVVALAPLAVALLAWSWPRDDSVASLATGAEWGFVLASGIVTALPLLLFAVAAQRVPFTLLGPIQYLVPIINFGLGWAVYGEPLPPARLVAFALVWGALALVTVEMVVGPGRVRTRTQRQTRADVSE